MSLEGAIDQLQAIARGLAGIKSAPDDPPEQASAFPFAVTYPSSGDWDGSSSGEILTRESHALTCEIHLGRSASLPSAIAQAIPYHDLFLAAIRADSNLNDEVEVIETGGYTFGPMQWANIDTIGYRFTVNVRIESC